MCAQGHDIPAFGMPMSPDPLTFRQMVEFVELWVENKPETDFAPDMKVALEALGVQPAI